MQPALPCAAGTGKTLSLICSALQWLQDKHARDAAPNCAVVAASPSGAPRLHTAAAATCHNQHRVILIGPALVSASHHSLTFPLDAHQWFFGEHTQCM